MRHLIHMGKHYLAEKVYWLEDVTCLKQSVRVGQDPRQLVERQHFWTSVKNWDVFRSILG